MTTSTARTTRTFRRWLLLAAGGTGWVVGLLAIVWLTLPQWFPIGLEWVNNKGSKWDALEFKIAHIDPHLLRLEDIHYQKNNLEITAQGISVSYHPQKLLKKEVDTILLDPIQVTLDLQLSRGQPKDQSTEKENSSVSPLTLLNGPLPSLPFHELLANSVRFEIAGGAAEEPFNMDLTFRALNDNERLLSDASLSGYGNRLSIQTNCGKTNPSDRKIQADVDATQPMLLLQKLLPLLTTDPKSYLTELPSTLALGSFYGTSNWQSREHLLQVHLLLKKLDWLDPAVDLETILLKIEADDQLDRIDGTLNVAAVNYAGIRISNPLADFSVTHPLTKNRRVQSKWTLPETVSMIGNGAATDERTEYLNPIEFDLNYENHAIHLSCPTLSSALIPAKIENLSAALVFPTNTIGATYHGNFSIQPTLSDWKTESMEPGVALNLDFSGHSEQEETGIESLHTDANLTIPELFFKSSFSEKQLEVDGIIQGQISAVQTGASLQTATDLKLKQLQLQLPEQLDLQLAGTLIGNATLNLQSDWGNFDVFSDITRPDGSVLLDATGHVGETLFAVSHCQIHVGSDLRSSKGEIPFTASLNHGNWDVWKVLNLQAEGSVSQHSLSATLSGNVINSSLSAQGQYNINWESGTQSATFQLQNQDPAKRTTLSLHKLFPGLATTIASAVMHATFQLIIKDESIKIPATVRLLDGAVNIPDAGVSFNGIDIPTCHFKDLVSGESDGDIQIRIAEIDYAPSKISHIECTLATTEDYTIEIKHLSFRFCEGTVSIHSNKPIAAPYHSWDLSIDFSNIDLQQLTALIPDFKEDLEGRIDGHLPFKMAKKQISWGKGFAHLTPGTTGRLRYADNGVFATYIPEIVISKDLEININDALRDITLTELSFDIQPSSHFDQPTVVLMSGHSNHHKISIPIERIQLNIRAGDVPGLLNRSFDLPQWIESLIHRE